MTLKETVFHELETADDLLLEDLLQVIRSRQTPKSTMTITDAIAIYRESAIAEGLDIDPDEIWGDVRDKTPADSEARW
jgi:lambda repressor-like predicted transcriptional regulator